MNLQGMKAGRRHRAWPMITRNSKPAPRGGPGLSPGTYRDQVTLTSRPCEGAQLRNGATSWTKEKPRLVRTGRALSGEVTAFICNGVGLSSCEIEAVVGDVNEHQEPKQ